MRVLLVGNGEGAAALAGGLDGEDIVMERRPDEPVPASGSDEIGALAHAGREPGGVNGRLIRQLSDVRLAPQPAAISNWLRDTYTQRP